MTRIVRCNHCGQERKDGWMHFTVDGTAVYELSGEEPTHFCSRICIGLYYLRVVAKQTLHGDGRNTVLEWVDDIENALRTGSMYEEGEEKS